MSKNDLQKQFNALLEKLNDDELCSLNNHFDSISSAIYKYFVNKYDVEMDLWTTKAEIELIRYVNEDFVKDHAKTLWSSVEFKLITISPDDAVESEISYWEP